MKDYYNINYFVIGLYFIYNNVEEKGENL